MIMKGTSDPVRIKGTRQGLVVSIREDLEFSTALEVLRCQLHASGSFFAGGSITLDLGWREVSDEELARLEGVLKEKGLRLLGVVSSSLSTRTRAEARGHKVIIGRLGLAGHQGRSIRREREARCAPPQQPDPPGPSPEPEVPEESVRLLRRTLRSGQRVFFPGTVVILGDVNPGAEIHAAGDILVWGSLRGMAHAGCEGNGGACVLALEMRAARIRIGDHVWHSEDNGRVRNQPGPVRVRLAGGEIRLEPYATWVRLTERQ